MLRLVDQLTPHYRLEACAGYLHFKPPEQHGPHRHFLDDGIEPFDQEKLDVGGLACYPDPSRGGDLSVHYDACERKCGLLEGVRRCRAVPEDADVGIMGKVLPSSADSRL